MKAKLTVILIMVCTALTCRAQITNTIVFQLSGEINDSVANKLQDFLLEHERNVNDTNVLIPVRIAINSPGGNVYALLGIIDTMQLVSYPVETECIGMAASSACVLLSMGKRGHRKAHKDSRIMIHNLTCSILNLDYDYETLQKETQTLHNEIFTMLSIQCNKSVEEIEAAIEKADGDLWMTADEALRFGLIDEIIE